MYIFIYLPAVMSNEQLNGMDLLSIKELTHLLN